MSSNVTSFFNIYMCSYLSFQILVFICTYMILKLFKDGCNSTAPNVLPPSKTIIQHEEPESLDTAKSVVIKSNGAVDKVQMLPSQESQLKVPNVVHYMWFQKRPVEFRFDKALCVLSAIKHLKPDAVYFHTNMPPKGKYFEMLKNNSVFKVNVYEFWKSYFEIDDIV